MNPLAVQLKLPSSLKVCPTFHVCLPKPVLSPTSSRLLSLPLPCCRRPGVHHLDFGRLLMREFQGYCPEEQPWVPGHHIPDKDLVRDFYRDHPISWVRHQEAAIQVVGTVMILVLVRELVRGVLFFQEGRGGSSSYVGCLHTFRLIDVISRRLKHPTPTFQHQIIYQW